MEPGVRALLSQVCKVMELILVLPATTAEAERCFSRLKLILTHLRSTLTQERLNHFMVMGLYPDLVDNLDTRIHSLSANQNNFLPLSYLTMKFKGVFWQLRKELKISTP